MSEREAKSFTHGSQLGELDFPVTHTNNTQTLKTETVFVKYK